MGDEGVIVDLGITFFLYLDLSPPPSQNQLLFLRIMFIIPESLSCIVTI